MHQIPRIFFKNFQNIQNGFNSSNERIGRDLRHILTLSLMHMLTSSRPLHCTFPYFFRIA